MAPGGQQAITTSQAKLKDQLLSGLTARGADLALARRRAEALVGPHAKSTQRRRTDLHVVVCPVLVVAEVLGDGPATGAIKHRSSSEPLRALITKPSPLARDQLR